MSADKRYCQTVGAMPHLGIRSEEFRNAAHQLVDYIVDYHETVGERQTFPDVKPGFMRSLVNEEAPEEAEEWPEVFKDLESVIMKGMTHWSSPGFVGFYPTGHSYPSVLGEMLSSAVSCVGFNWATSPSCTELETVMMDWLAKAIGLPSFYFHDGKGPGGGVILGSATEATLVTLLSARSKAIREQLSIDPNQHPHDICKRFVAYTSVCCHSSVERAGKVAMVEIRLLEPDDEASLRGDALMHAVEKDKANGRIPIYVCANLGTTPCCTYDNLNEIGPICERENMWLHVDAAYAGAALVCPEFRYIARGLEHTTSFNYNPHKWGMVTFDCSALWVKDSSLLTDSFTVDRPYFKHEAKGATISYMDWQIPSGRRFRAIKLWFVLRMIGLDGLRRHVRKGVAFAKRLEELVRADDRFEIAFPVTLGLVCLRLNLEDWNAQKANEMNKELYDRIVADRRFFLSPACFREKYYIRISTGSVNCSFAKIDELWDVITDFSNELLKAKKIDRGSPLVE